MAAHRRLSLGGNREGAQEACRAAKPGIEKLRPEQPDSPFIAIRLAFSEAGLGNKEAALREGARALALVPAGKDPVFGPGMEEALAGVKAQVGEINRAMARVERLLTYGAFPITQATLRLDPTWIPLRQHPRLIALIDGPEAKTVFN